MFGLNWADDDSFERDNFNVNKKRKIEKEEDENDASDENDIDVHVHSGFGNNLYIRSDGSDIYFYSGIDKKSILLLQKETKKVVDNIVSKATEAEKVGCVVTYPPIKIHINSPGGYIYPAFSFIDYMTQTKLRNPKIKFHSIIEGGSASAATLISVMADKRFIAEYGYMLIHQLSGCAWGKYSDMKDDMKNSTELMNRIKKIYSDHTKLPTRDLNKILKHDLYWDASKCLELGLVDEIIQ